MPSLAQRKAQNREAQRRFREKKKIEGDQLAVKNKELMLEISKLQTRLEYVEAIDKPSQQVHSESRDLSPAPYVPDSIGNVEATVSAPTPSSNPPEFTLSELTEDYGPHRTEGFTENLTNSTSPDFIFDFQIENSIDNQFQFTPESFTPPVPDDGGTDPNAQDQTSLMTRISSPSPMNCDYPNQDVEYHSGAMSSCDFGDSFFMPPFCPDTYTASFQVTQLLEVAKQKEHAARLLQEAARCREYTVHSLLSSQGAWGVHSSSYPFNSLPTGSTHPHESIQETWDSRDTATWNSASTMATISPVT